MAFLGRAATTRWVMRIVGIVLIALTVTAAGYARFAGEELQRDHTLPAGDHYLLTTARTAHCTVRANGTEPPHRFELSPIGARELLDGKRIEAPPGGVTISCAGGDVTATSGGLLALYPLAEYDYLPVIAGAALIVTARFVRSSRRANG